MPKVKTDKDRRRQRRRSKEAHELHLSKKYKQKIVPSKKEDDSERRFRRFKDTEELSPDESES